MKTKENIEYQIQILTQLYLNLTQEGNSNENTQLYASSLKGAIHYLKWVLEV